MKSLAKLLSVYLPQSLRPVWPIAAVVGITLIAYPTPIAAQVAAPKQFFKATATCAATRAIRGGNPGNIKLTVDRVYPAIGINRQNGTHVLLDISEAKPNRRWVSLNCGQFQATAGDEPINPPAQPDPSLTPLPAPAQTPAQFPAQFPPVQRPMHSARSGQYPKPSLITVAVLSL